jgi:DNA-binding CsgD family transcriptional regulator
VNPVNTPVNAREEILRLAAEGIAQREIARRLDCSPSYVNKVVNGG